MGKFKKVSREEAVTSASNIQKHDVNPNTPQPTPSSETSSKSSPHQTATKQTQIDTSNTTTKEERGCMVAKEGKAHNYGNLGLKYYRSEQGYGKDIEKFKLNDTFELHLGKNSFCLVTQSPGLLIGSGYMHPKRDENKDDFQLGFFFDHTSGLPVIPGSSIKGVLRSAFRCPEYIKELIPGKSIDIEKLEKEIFDGVDPETNKQKSIYQRDIFFDAFIVSTKDGKLFYDDYITPHKNIKNTTFEDGTRVPDEFCEPNPIRFLIIRPNVKFCFSFDLKDGLLSAKEKLSLLKQIILDLGLGAKTNVGYGQFSDN